MAIENKKNIRNKIKNATYENVDKIIYGDENSVTINYYFNNQQDYEKISEKNDDYMEFYEKYIKKFEELDNYSYHIIFPKFEDKKYDFISDYLIFGKKIIEWVFGVGAFPNKSLHSFYLNLQKEFKFNDDALICKRWKANLLYFDGNLKAASEEYEKLYDYAISKSDEPSWYLDDICIDGRNIFHQYEGTINKFTFDNKFQTHLSTNKHKLTYPDVDRIKAEIFDDLAKNVFNNKNKSKHTVIYGIGLEKYFNQIQHLIYLTIFYGSITHLQLIRKIISNVMYIYGDTFHYQEFYEECLKMLFLSGEFKKYENLYNKINLKYNFVNSQSFIKLIIDSKKSLLKFEIDKSNIFLFDIYGRYFDDDLFEEYLNDIISIIKIKPNFQIDLISNAIKSISKNIKRMKNLDEVLEIIIEYFEKGYSRFYIDIGKIVNEIDIENLNNNEFKKICKILDYLIINKQHINFLLSDIIIGIKKRCPKLKKYDKYLYQKGSDENILYNVKIANNELEAVKDIINIFKKRHEEQENHPNVISSYMTDYNIGLNIFSKDNYFNNRQVIIEKYLPLAESIITSKNECSFEKIKHVKLLCYILQVETDSKVIDKIKNVIYDENIMKCNENEFELIPSKLKNKKDLEININMCKSILGDFKYKNLLLSYINIILQEESSYEEVLLCLNIINNDLKKYEEEELNYFYIIFNITYKSDDIDVRNLSIMFSKVFINTKYNDEIIMLLKENVDKIGFLELRGYFQLIKNCNIDEKENYIEIIKALKKHSNYYIKYICLKYL